MANDGPIDGVDDETPLLPQKAVKPTPLPWAQFIIVLFIQLAEPLTSQVIYPFAPQLIREVGVTGGDEAKVGYYVGLLQSSFFATQALTVLHWSRISDRVGRKPVLIVGLLGISLSMYSFGLSTTYPGVVISRCLNGALNGNIGIMKSMMAELTDSSNVAQAFAYMPIAWSTGGTLGPLIGGALSRPAERYPHLFGSWQFMKDYPYFLACCIPATYALVAVFIVRVFLKETNPVPSPFRRFKFWRRISSQDTLVADPSTSESSKQISGALPLKALLTKRVIIATLNYSMLSLTDIAFRGVQPVFFATHVDFGGLGFAPPAIGLCLSIFGLANGLFQVFCFARIHRRVGGKNLFLFSLATGIPIFGLFPIMSAIIRVNGHATTLIWFLIALQLGLYILFNMAYSSVFIYIAAASPNRQSIGATNGIAQMAVSVMRTIGPSFASSLYSLSIEHNYLGGYLVWWALLLLDCISLGCGLLLPSKVWKRLSEL